jgi:hypothetical protein
MHFIEQSPALWGHCGRDRMVVGFELPMQSMPITTDVGSTPAQGSSLRVPACLQTHLYKEKISTL